CVEAAKSIALVGHPPAGPCYEVTTRYGRSIRVTGDHSLFIEGPDGQPLARPVSELSIGDRVAIAGRIVVPERDRTTVSLVDVWERAGRDPWDLHVVADGLGATLWERRREAFPFVGRIVSPDARAFRNSCWAQIARWSKNDTVPLALMRLM